MNNPVLISNNNACNPNTPLLVIFKTSPNADTAQFIILPPCSKNFANKPNIPSFSSSVFPAKASSNPSLTSSLLTPLCLDNSLTILLYSCSISNCSLFSSSIPFMADSSWFSSAFVSSCFVPSCLSVSALTSSLAICPIFSISPIFFPSLTSPLSKAFFLFTNA